MTGQRPHEPHAVLPAVQHEDRSSRWTMEMSIPGQRGR